MPVAMHFKKTKTKTKPVKKNLVALMPIEPVVEVKPAVVEEPEWVTLPKAGDCIAVRVDSDASVEHLPSVAEKDFLKRQPTETKRYLGIVSGVLTAPTKKKPWCTCIVHILPPPKTHGGVIVDFQPRSYSVVRLRPRTTQRVPMLEVAAPLLAQLYKAANWIGAHVDTRPLSWAAELNQEHWVTTRWVIPEQVKRSAHRTTVLPPNAVLYEPELDSYHVVDFDYSWEGDFGGPQANCNEQNLIANKILLARAMRILADNIPDPKERDEEFWKVHKAISTKLGALCRQPAWATVTQTVQGVTATHRYGTPPAMNPYAHQRAMSMP